jgi:hypothetical protein
MPVEANTHTRRDQRTGALSFISGRVLDIAGLSIHAQAPDRPRAEAMARLLDSADPHPGPVDVTVVWRDEPFANPRQPSEHPFPGLGLWHRADGTTFIVHHGAVTAFGSAASLVVGGGQPGSSRLWLDFRRVFEAGLASLLAQRERYMLHGAAIAGGGRALLLLGPTGSGKSTLAWAARRAGWGVLADDQVFVRPSSGEYAVCGMRKPVAVPGELFSEAPAGAHHRERGGRSRWEIPASALAGGWHRVSGILSPKHARSGDGDIVRLSSHELLPALLGAFAGSGHPPLLRGWLPHAAALSRVGGWEIQLARPVERRLDAAAALLDSELGRA